MFAARTKRTSQGTRTYSESKGEEARGRKEEGGGAEVATVRRDSEGERKCRKPSTRIGRKAWKQARRKRKKAPEEPPTGENGKKGKERTEG